MPFMYSIIWFIEEFLGILDIIENPDINRLSGKNSLI